MLYIYVYYANIRDRNFKKGRISDQYFGQANKRL